MTQVAAETVLVEWLRTAFPSVRVVTETPANLADVLPVIQVTRFGGADEYIPAFDNPSMDFDVYAATRDAARGLAHDVRDSLRGDLPGATVLGVSVVRVRSISGPAWTFYNNTSMRRFTYSANLRLHYH